MRTLRYIFAVVALVAAVIGTVSLDAEATDDNFTPGTLVQPYGGCKEAWPYYIDTPGADDCRALGWHVSKRLLVDARHVLRATTLPACRYEDGSGQRSACVWLGNDFGNGRGATYWVDRHDQVHYIWQQGTRAHLVGRWHFSTPYEREHAPDIRKWDIVKRTSIGWFSYGPAHGWRVVR